MLQRATVQSMSTSHVTWPAPPFHPCRSAVAVTRAECNLYPNTPLTLCGSDGRTYPSLRAACLATANPLCFQTCPCPWAPPVPPVVPVPTPAPPAPAPGEACRAVACIASVDPVCCMGREYSNQCWADACNFTADMCTPGPCPPVDPACTPGCACPASYQPVCCGGTTYSNQCSATCCHETNCKPGVCEG